MSSKWRQACNIVTLCHRMTRGSIPDLTVTLLLLWLAVIGTNFWPAHPILLGLTLLSYFVIQALSGFRIAELTLGSRRGAPLLTSESAQNWLDGILLWSFLRNSAILPLAVWAPAGYRGALVLIFTLVLVFGLWSQTLMLAHFSDLDQTSCCYVVANQAVVLVWPSLMCLVPAAPVTSAFWIFVLAYGLLLGTLMLRELVQWHLERWRSWKPGLVLLAITAIYPALYLVALAQI